LANDAGLTGTALPPPPPERTEPRITAKSHHPPIRVSPAVLDAARKDGEELLRDLGTSLSGLSQTEAERRARISGPNEIAQERKQGWLVRILKIIRNPLVILLTILSAVSFLTGDARAGFVMALMVTLSVGLRWHALLAAASSSWEPSRDRDSRDSFSVTRQKRCWTP
jgi:Mg2+-importing ATPase